MARKKKVVEVKEEVIQERKVFALTNEQMAIMLQFTKERYIRTVHNGGLCDVIGTSLPKYLNIVNFEWNRIEVNKYINDFIESGLLHRIARKYNCDLKELHGYWWPKTIKVWSWRKFRKLIVRNTAPRLATLNDLINYFDKLPPNEIASFN